MPGGPGEAAEPSRAMSRSPCSRPLPHPAPGPAPIPRPPRTPRPAAHLPGWLLCAIGTAAGLSRTSVYIGAIGASSLIGGVFGTAPTTPDLHVLAWVIVGVAVAASVLTIADRALARAVTDRTPSA